MLVWTSCQAALCVCVCVRVSLVDGQATLKGLSKLEVNAEVMNEDLNNNWEVLAEPIQTVMRKATLDKPYEKLKELTRGKAVDQQGMQEFVGKLDIPQADKERLMALTPGTYTGLSQQLAEKL